MRKTLFQVGCTAGIVIASALAALTIHAQRLPRPALAVPQITVRSTTLDCMAGAGAGFTPTVGFNFYRQTGTGNISRINATQLPACHYVDLAVTAGSTYIYTARAVNAGGIESPPSNAVTAAIPADPPPPPPPPGCVISSQGTFRGGTFPMQSAGFTATFQATPSSQTMDAVVGLSRVAATGYPSMTAIVRFINSVIEARNGGAYTAAVQFPFTAGTVYSFRLVVNPSTRTYDAFVKAGTGGESQIAVNYAFRSDAPTTLGLGNWATTSEQGTVQVCAFTIAGAPPPPVTITVAPPSPVTVLPGSTRQFSATVTGSTNTTATWAADGGTITPAGLYTAGTTAGTFTVTARSVADPTKTATAAVTIPARTFTQTCATQTAPVIVCTYTLVNFLPGKVLTSIGTLDGVQATATATTP